MPLINNPFLYTGGNVRLDSTPSVNFYAQLQAKKAAQQDAIDQYIRGLNTRVNPAGVRVQDLPAFAKMKDDWVKYGLQNKKEIATNPLARADFEAGAQRLMNFANESKQTEEGKKPLVELLVDPSKRAKISDEVFPHIQSHDEPLYVQDAQGNFVRNPNHQRIDYNMNLFKEPNFDFSKTFGDWAKGMEQKEIKGNMIKRDPISGMVTYETEKKFDPEQLRQIATNAARSLQDNEDYMDYYKRRLNNIGEKEYNQLQDIYRNTIDPGQRVVNSDGTISIVGGEIDSPQKLAMADAILQGKSMAQKGTKDILDRALANERAVNKIFISQGGKSDSGQQINDIYSVIDDYVTNKSKGNLFFPNRKFLDVTDLPLDAQTLVVQMIPGLEKYTDKGELPQAQIKLKKENDGTIGVYGKENGAYLGKLPKVGTNLKVQPSVKEKREVIKQGEAIPKTKSKKDPLGLF